MVNGGREETPLEAIDWIRRLESARRRARSCSPRWIATAPATGYDLAAPPGGVGGGRPIPVIASGGAGRLEHLAEAFEAGAHGVLAATIFHFQGSTLPEARAYLRERGYPVRP